MITNDNELNVTLERIAGFQRQLAHLRQVETNPANYHAAASGFLKEVDRMHAEVRRYWRTHPAELEAMGARRLIRTIEQFTTAVTNGSLEWPEWQPRWFRGEPSDGKTLVPSKTLVPRLYRHDPGPTSENQLLHLFRARAAAYAAAALPDRERTDEWLFLAQHVGLPTRLLDWSESALVALYFALKTDTPVVLRQQFLPNAV